MVENRFKGRGWSRRDRVELRSRSRSVESVGLKKTSVRRKARHRIQTLAAKSKHRQQRHSGLDPALLPRAPSLPGAQVGSLQIRGNRGGQRLAELGLHRHHPSSLRLFVELGFHPWNIERQKRRQKSSKTAFLIAYRFLFVVLAEFFSFFLRLASPMSALFQPLVLVPSHTQPLNLSAS